MKKLKQILLMTICVMMSVVFLIGCDQVKDTDATQTEAAEQDDSYVDSIDDADGTINYNGFTLYVGGVAQN